MQPIVSAAIVSLGIAAGVGLGRLVLSTLLARLAPVGARRPRAGKQSALGQEL